MTITVDISLLDQGQNVSVSTIPQISVEISLTLPGPQGIQGVPGPAGTTTWNGITDKPATFTPSTHAHDAAVAAGAAGFMSGADKTKLDSVEASANNYSHPANHVASVITQDAANRFVTDIEKTAWNAKDTSGGYAGLTLFKLNLKNVAGTITSWFTTAATVARTWTMPDKDGTVAMTSDFAAPGAIGGTTPAAGSFTTLAASDAVTINRPGSTTVPNLNLSGTTNNWINYSTAGLAAPSFTTRSLGTKIVLYPFINAASADYAIGVESGTVWNSVGTTANNWKWYGGTTLAATLSGTGNLTVVGTVTGTNLAYKTTNTFAGAQIGSVTALTSTAANMAIDLATNNNFSHATSENTTLAAPSNPVAGQSGVITITQGATARLLAYNTFWKFPGGTVPTLTAVVGAVDVLAYSVESATRATCQLLKDVK